jgi:hypothetical protein
LRCGSRLAISDDHIRLESGEISRQHREAFVVATRPADLDPNVLPFDIAEPLETPSEAIDPRIIRGR